MEIEFASRKGAKNEAIDGTWFTGYFNRVRNSQRRNVEES
jgi:hypothetical protein